MSIPDVFSSRKSSISRQSGQALLDDRRLVNLYDFGMDLKDWVKKAREVNGWTLEQLAQAMGRSKAAVGFWEAGSTRPSYAQVKRLSELSGLPMPDGTATEVPGDLQRARARRWPFQRIDQQKLMGLSGANARNLENAMIAAATDLNIDIRPSHSGKIKSA